MVIILSWLDLGAMYPVIAPANPPEIIVPKQVVKIKLLKFLIVYSKSNIGGTSYFELQNITKYNIFHTIPNK